MVKIAILANTRRDPFHSNRIDECSENEMGHAWCYQFAKI